MPEVREEIEMTEPGERDREEAVELLRQICTSQHESGQDGISEQVSLIATALASAREEAIEEGERLAKLMGKQCEDKNCPGCVEENEALSRWSKFKEQYRG
jgi:hypothetical protein